MRDLFVFDAIGRHYFAILSLYLPIEGGAICRGRKAEESPDRTGHPAAESAGGSNFTQVVTENNRQYCRETDVSNHYWQG